LHVSGISEENKDLSVGKILAGFDDLQLQVELRFDWTPRWCEGIRIFLGDAAGFDKWKNYSGGKLQAELMMRHDPAWNDREEMVDRQFAPGEVGNSSSSSLYAKTFLLDSVSLTPSRMRGDDVGDRYFEFFLTFSKSKALNGLWAVSESAAEGVEGIPYYFFKLKTEEPFWKRGAERHEQEIEEMPTWQKTK